MAPAETKWAGECGKHSRPVGTPELEGIRRRWPDGAPKVGAWVAGAKPSCPGPRRPLGRRVVQGLPPGHEDLAPATQGFRSAHQLARLTNSYAPRSTASAAGGGRCGWGGVAGAREPGHVGGSGARQGFDRLDLEVAEVGVAVARQSERDGQRGVRRARR